MMDSKALAKSKRAHSQHHSKKPPSSTYPSQAPHSIVPRSKAADFRHLVAEAQSQSQSQSHPNPYSNALSSLDDILPGDFNQFVGSMLAVRGEGILSWTANDNFIVDDTTAATPEASFLSLNLHALAEQLEKVDLSGRLFIEEDILPPDLRSERSKVNNYRESQQMQAATDKKAAAKITEEITQNDFPEGLGTMPEVHSDSISGPCGEFSESRAPDCVNSTSVSNKEVSTFEPTAAEAELDMLLNSFSEIDTTSSGSRKPSSDLYIEGSPFLPQYAREGIDSVKVPPVTSDFDGLLDDLLQETSTTVKQGIDSSKTAADNSTFDDILDDLLQETFTMVNPNNVEASSSSSKVLSDFESWLDTF
ncbi:hypothetical protein GQ457_10G017100 [Hibiscus cannabinus]